MTLFQAKNLYKRFGKAPVVEDLSFKIEEGEVIGLLGPNGAGKTTAFYMAIGLIKPDKGSIYFQGHEITKVPMHKRAEMGIGYLAQEPSIFRSLTVENNLRLVLETLSLKKDELEAMLDERLEELHLTKHRKKIAACLSGGERRRLEITRALIRKPKLLLLDEPFANIDPITIDEVKELILELKSKKISILITDHNAKELIPIVDRTYLMQGGKMFFSGTPKELMKSVDARRAYLGEGFFASIYGQSLSDQSPSDRH